MIRYGRAVAGTTCASCGCEDEPLVVVRRVYLMAGDGPSVGEGLGAEAAEVESWCALCRDFYPHVVI